MIEVEYYDSTRHKDDQPMTTEENPRMEVECNDCQFSRIVEPGDEELPGEVVIKHGDETGHQLSLNSIDD